MKVCVVGAGAVGGFLAVKLSIAGIDVSIVDQGAHLEAIRNAGLRLQLLDGSIVSADKIRVLDKIDDVGVADVVILGVKANQIVTVAPKFPLLYGPDTIVVTLQNGIPWWYFQRHGGALDGTRLTRLDPDDVISEHIPAERIIGCVVYPALTTPEPGVVKHIEGDRFPVGELDGAQTGRITQLAELLDTAGLKTFVLENVREEIWLKAWGALSFNPISALTQTTMVEICQFTETRELARTMMSEAQEIANKIGISFRHPIEKRISGAESVGAHKTSMLQDLQAGRPLEVEALIGSLLELSRITNTPCPAIHAVYACTKLLDYKVQEMKTTLSLG